MRLDARKALRWTKASSAILSAANVAQYVPFNTRFLYKKARHALPAPEAPQRGSYSVGRRRRVPGYDVEKEKAARQGSLPDAAYEGIAVLVQRVAQIGEHSTDTLPCFVMGAGDAQRYSFTAGGIFGTSNSRRYYVEVQEGGRVLRYTAITWLKKQQ